MHNQVILTGCIKLNSILLTCGLLLFRIRIITIVERLVTLLFWN